MARQINTPIRVFLTADRAAPAAFLWEDRRYRVRRVDACWKEAGSWWNGGGERIFFRVSTDEGTYELTLDQASGQWLLERILD
jgi:hypothetical protein